jgi:hypothetical protein
MAVQVGQPRAAPCWARVQAACRVLDGRCARAVLWAKAPARVRLRPRGGAELQVAKGLEGRNGRQHRRALQRRAEERPADGGRRPDGGAARARPCDGRGTVAARNEGAQGRVAEETAVEHAWRVGRRAVSGERVQALTPAEHVQQHVF